MEWFPCGPDFVFDPVDVGYTRLSPSNEGGISGRVLSIAIDPAALYVVGGQGQTASGSSSVFRRGAADPRWSCPGDALLQAHPQADPNAVAAHPSFPDHVYVGTWNDQAVYAYDHTTHTWGARNAVPGRVRKLIVDPRPTALASTILYAATDTGVYRSPDNGGSWAQILAGDCRSLAAHIPVAGSPRFYAGLHLSGVWFADSEPLAPAAWTHLTIAPPGFENVLVDYCPANPDCAYAWFGSEGVPDAIYNTLDPRGTWTLKNGHPTTTGFDGMPYALEQWQTFDNFNFAVAPDSPGDGTHDVLVFGSRFYFRSRDSGVTWTLFHDLFHADVHDIVFAPGTPPALHIGCDGGLAVYSEATLASFDPSRVVIADDRSSRDAVSPLTRTYRNGNRGLANSCVYALAQDPAGLTLLYQACVDCGIAFKDGGLGWRSLTGGDAFRTTVSRAADGVRLRQEVFGGLGVGGQLTLTTHSETGGGVSGDAYPAGDPDGRVITTSNYVVDGAGDCYAGGFLSSIAMHTTALIPAASGHTVTIPVDSTVGMTAGCSISFDNDRPQSYDVVSFTSTSFDIYILYQDVPAGTGVRLLQLCAFRNALDRSTARVSQLFTPNTRHNTVTAFARGGGRLACSTYDDVAHATALWVVDEAATAGGPATWTQVVLPAGVPSVAALTADLGGDIYVLFSEPFGATPLYRLAAGATVAAAEACTSLPAAPFRCLVADPTRPGVLWASAGGQVYRLVLSTPSGARSWNWQPAGTGLPGTWVTDLAFTNGILRAATNGRGVWELDARDGAVPLATDLYVRRHLLDDGWSSALADGVPHPLRPGEQVWHWECVDIKVDRPVATAGGAYFQTDPDASGSPYSNLTVAPGPVPSITNLQFDMLEDFGRAVPAGHRVRLHVQVQNRATAPAAGVSVWLLWTQPSGLLPALNLKDDLTTFDHFWDQFRADGSIVPALPPNSRWQSVGLPITLDPVAVDHPQVASWNWDAPAPAGHYCVIAIVHSHASPIGETTDMSVDDIVLHNKQLGQKNLQVIV